MPNWPWIFLIFAPGLVAAALILYVMAREIRRDRKIRDAERRMGASLRHRPIARTWHDGEWIDDNGNTGRWSDTYGPEA
jgi:hypothetical protein